MSVALFLCELRSQDIRVWLDGDQLRCEARAGALTEELRAELRSRKSDIVGFLHKANAVAALPGAIVPLQRGGAGAPVFAVPGHTGDVFAYRAFAQALGEERPFFALQPPGLEGASRPLGRVEDLGAYFAEQVRAVSPRGPWIIAGYCMGGTVAFELAQRLLGRGEDGFLAFFGVPYPSFFRRAGMLRHRFDNRLESWRRRARLLASQGGRERLDYVLWRLRVRKEAPDAFMLRRASLEAATLAAVRAYEPRSFTGRLHHFLPCASWARRWHTQSERWRSVAARLESDCGTEGCHADDMLLGAHLPALTQHFRRSCARAGL